MLARYARQIRRSEDAATSLSLSRAPQMLEEESGFSAMQPRVIGA